MRPYRRRRGTCCLFNKSPSSDHQGKFSIKSRKVENGVDIILLKRRVWLCCMALRVILCIGTHRNELIIPSQTACYLDSQLSAIFLVYNIIYHVSCLGCQSPSPFLQKSPQVLHHPNPPPPILLYMQQWEHLCLYHASCLIVFFWFEFEL